MQPHRSPVTTADEQIVHDPQAMASARAEYLEVIHDFFGRDLWMTVSQFGQSSMTCKLRKTPDSRFSVEVWFRRPWDRHVEKDWELEVSWASYGSVSLDDAYEFANALADATTLAEAFRPRFKPEYNGIPVRDVQENIAACARAAADAREALGRTGCWSNSELQHFYTELTCIEA